MFELLYTSEPVVTNLLASYSPMIFIKSWVALLYCSNEAELDTTALHISKLFHDGTKITVSGFGSSGSGAFYGILIAREDGKACSINKVGDFAEFYPVDEFIATGQAEPFAVTPCGLKSEGLIEPGDSEFFVDATQNLVIQCYTGAATYLYGHDLTTGARLWTLTFEKYDTYFPSARMSWVGSRTMLWSQKTTGVIHFIYFDREGAQIKSSGKVDPCWQIAYDCVNNVIMTMGNDKRLRIYHPTGVPHNLSNPSISPMPVQRLGSYNVEVQLLGDFGEPCVGWWINWYLTYGKGYMRSLHTLTDEEGKATNIYIAPTDPGNVGVETITAEVVV